jgi:predicted lipoprotein with Yx(FWY)xxD motif
MNPIEITTKYFELSRNYRRPTMRHTFVALAVLLASLILAVSATAMNHEVDLANSKTVGEYLTDAQGMTLYWLKTDSPGVSTCAGGCLENWPAFYRKSVAATGGLKTSDFGSITREDGKMQTTYKGYPLYYFVKDKKAGDTNGQGARGVWYAVNPKDLPPAKKTGGY